MLVQGKCKNIPFLLIRVGVVYFVTHCQYSTAELNLPIVEADIKNDRLNILVDYFNDTRHNHDGYTFRFFFCELLNFVNVVGQIYFMDFFLGGEFTTYGSDVLAMSELPQEDRYDPMAAVFPKVSLKRHKIISFHSFLPGHKMYFPQVRSFWNCREERRPLHSSPQHHQREDLRLPLVLVHLPCYRHWNLRKYRL